MEPFIQYALSKLANIHDTNALKVFALIFVRLTIIVTLAPFLGGKNAPSPVKMGLSILLSALLAPLILAQSAPLMTQETLPFLGLLLKEVFIGFAIGFVTSEIFYVVEMSGQLIDIVRGTNQIQLMVPEITDRSSAFGNLHYQLMLVLFLAMNFHVFFFDALVESFNAVPVHAWPAFTGGSFAFFNEFAVLISRMFFVAVTLALPAGVVCLFVDIAFGLLNRVAPQINAYFMSMPVKALGGVLISFAALSMTFSQFDYYGERMAKTLVNWIILFK